jgi:hypothetical protein
MSEQSLDMNTQATDAAEITLENQAPATKTYTQDEFDRHMAGLKSSLQKKYEKTFSDLGDIDELRALKTQAEAKKLEEAKKRGEFEKVLQELAAKKDAEIQKRDSVIKEYKVNTPLLSAAAQYRAVNAEQVKALLSHNVRLNPEGEVEVVGNDGSVRYSDTGAPLGVNDLVREFLDSNPHFVQSSPATTNSKSSVSNPSPGKLDISSLDMKDPEHRRQYAEYRKVNGLA